MREVMALACIGCLSGCGASLFTCLGPEDCGPDGFCSTGGFCAFPDDDCASGLRYGTHAPDGLAGVCVIEESDTGTSGGSNSTSTSTSSPSDSTSTTTTTTDAASSDTGSRVDDGTTTTTDGSTGETAGSRTVTVSFGERDDADFSDVTRDSYVTEWEPMLNFGTHNDFHIYGNGSANEVSLLEIDVSALPSDADVLEAELRIWTEDEVDDGAIQVHRVVEAWDEGTEDGGAGICNYMQRMQDLAWTSPGVGYDSYDLTVLAEFTAPDPWTEVVIPIPPATIENMRDDPDANHGFLLRSTSHQGTWFLSREFADPDVRPLLVVTYVN